MSLVSGIAGRGREGRWNGIAVMRLLFAEGSIAFGCSGSGCLDVWLISGEMR